MYSTNKKFNKRSENLLYQNQNILLTYIEENKETTILRQKTKDHKDVSSLKIDYTVT